MKMTDVKPGARIIERANACAHPRTILMVSEVSGEKLIHVKNDTGRKSTIRARNIARYDLVTVIEGSRS